MKCPICNSALSHVTETRKYGSVVYRMRECHGCDRRYATCEKHFGAEIPREALPRKKPARY